MLTVHWVDWELTTTLCNNLTLFEVWFSRQLVLVRIIFDSIWSCEGQINTCVASPGWNTLQKWKKGFHSMTMPAIRHQLIIIIIIYFICNALFIQKNLRVPVSVLASFYQWQSVGGICKVFACLIGS